MHRASDLLERHRADAAVGERFDRALILPRGERFRADQVASDDETDPDRLPVFGLAGLLQDTFDDGEHVLGGIAGQVEHPLRYELALSTGRDPVAARADVAKRDALLVADDAEAPRIAHSVILGRSGPTRQRSWRVYATTSPRDRFRDNWSAIDAPTSHATYRKTRIFGSLDGLRALAIIGVVWHHAAGTSSDVALLHHGEQGVTLFFAISGYLITTLLLRERERYGQISLKLFYIRRTLRIMPLYYGVILLYCAAVYFAEKDAEAANDFYGNLVYFFTFTSNWFVDGTQGRVIFLFAWTLATEEQFYLVWPSVERYLPGKAWVVVLLTLLGIQFAATDFGLMEFGTLGQRMAASIAPAILYGVLLAHLLHDERSYNLLRPVLGQIWSAAFWMIAFIAAVATMDSYPFGTRVVELTAVLVVGASVYREDNTLALPHRWRPYAWIGTVSYGLYMLNMLGINAVRTAFRKVGLEHPVLLFVIGLAVGVAIASISYIYYESFFLRLKERWGQRPKTPKPA